MTPTDIPLLSAAPPYAHLCWCDDRWIYCELPCTSAPPYVLKFPNDPTGLSKALNLLRSAFTSSIPREPTNYTRHPLVKDEDRKVKALGILRRMGLLG